MMMIIIIIIVLCVFQTLLLQMLLRRRIRNKKYNNRNPRSRNYIHLVFDSSERVGMVDLQAAEPAKHLHHQHSAVYRTSLMNQHDNSGNV